MTDISSSTSWHTLSADYGITKIQRVLWMIYNLANNAFPRSNVDARIVDSCFRLPECDVDRYWGDVDDMASPARRLCDFFWMSMPWDRLASALSPVRALETGCGTGVYGRLLERLLGPDFEKYLGVDIQAKSEWDLAGDDARFDFSVGRAGEAHTFLRDANLIFTQSALEHFDEDLQYFMQVSEYVAQADFPILQVHLIPSASCISTYPWHGIREYTPRTISKITRLFDDKTNSYLFALGGNRCNQVHRRYITWPIYRHHVDLRESKTEEYRAALRPAILGDFAGSGREASFYALVLASGFETDVFANCRNARR